MDANQKEEERVQIFCVNFVCDKKEDKLQAGMQLHVLELKRMKHTKKIRWCASFWLTP
jgi:hypothetical protein